MALGEERAMADAGRAVVEAFLGRAVALREALVARLGEGALVRPLTPGLPREGVLDESRGARFRLHDTGVEIDDDGVILELTLGPGGRVDGLDVPRLARFVRTSRAFPELEPPGALQRAVQALKAEGYLVSPRFLPGPHLAYRATSLDADAARAPA